MAKNMKDLRQYITKAERVDIHMTMVSLRQYLLPLLKQRSGNKCEYCGCSVNKWDIHHKLYNPKVSINELELLCHACHKNKTNYIHMRYRKGQQSLMTFI